MVLTESVVGKIVRQWGIEAATVGQAAGGYRNEVWPLTTTAGEPLVLILYKDEPRIEQRIKRTNELGQLLYDKGLPARRPYSSMTVVNQRPRRFFGLYYYLPGKTIPWEAYTMNHLKLLGWAMGDMHAATLNSHIALPSAIDSHRNLLNEMSRYLSGRGVRDAVQEKLRLKIPEAWPELHTALDTCATLPAQPLHLDMVRGNVLFDQAKPDHHWQMDQLALSGILDLEKTERGPAVMDVARTLAFLLVDCKYKSSDKVRKYFLASGYQKRGYGVIETPALLEQLVSLYLFYDFYKFLRHNPYESLRDNEHFQRTKVLLLKRHLLITTDATIGTANRRG